MNSGGAMPFGAASRSLHHLRGFRCYPSRKNALAQKCDFLGDYFKNIWKNMDNF
jgi:hypothetical protein